MRLILSPITVRLDGSKPVQILYRKRWYTIEKVVDFWVVQDSWWKGGRTRHYIQALTDSGYVEIYRDEKRQWILSRMWD